MALITCPECKREISDKAVSCPHCGYPINDPTVPDVENNIMVYKGQRYNMTELIEYHRANIAPNEQFCDHRSDDIRKILDKCIPEMNGLEKNELLIYIKRYQKVPDFNFIPSGDIWKYSLEKPRSYYEDTSNKPPVPKCPKCGCENIQVIPKKWSFFTGFLTNKTDRVCANCGHKW